MRSATTNTKKRFPQKALAAAITTIILGASTTAMAFKPAIKNHGHTYITSSVLGHSTDSRILGGVDYSGFYYFGNPAGGIKFSTEFSDHSLGFFSQQASTAITIGNESTDYITYNYWQLSEGTQISLNGKDDKPESSNPVAHCDDEMIIECSERIKGLKDEVYEALHIYAQNIDSTNTFDHEYPQTIAWIKLGKALHTIQDFYAHSNFADINLSSTAYFAELTSGNIDLSKLAKESTKSNGKIKIIRDNAVCKARLEFASSSFSRNGGNWELFASGKNELTSGYFDAFGSIFGAYGIAADLGDPKCDHGLDILGTLSGIAKDDP